MRRDGLHDDQRHVQQSKQFKSTLEPHISWKVFTKEWKISHQVQHVLAEWRDWKYAFLIWSPHTFTLHTSPSLICSVCVCVYTGSGWISFTMHAVTQLAGGRRWAVLLRSHWLIVWRLPNAYRNVWNYACWVSKKDTWKLYILVII